MLEQNSTPKIWEDIDFTIYFSFVRWPVIIGLILELAWRWWSGAQVGLWTDQTELIAWLIRLAIFAWLGWRAFINFGPASAIAALAGVLAGAEIGLAVAITRFFGGIKLWQFFNLLTETALAAVVGSLVGILILMVLNRQVKKYS